MQGGEVFQIFCMEGTALYPVEEGPQPSSPFDGNVQGQGQGRHPMPHRLQQILMCHR